MKNHTKRENKSDEEGLKTLAGKVPRHSGLKRLKACGTLPKFDVSLMFYRRTLSEGH